MDTEPLYQHLSLPSWHKVSPLKKSYKEISAAKQADALAKIPSEWLLDNAVATTSGSSNGSILNIPRICGILSPAQIEITENYTAVALAKGLAAGKLSALDVAEAFCKRAAIAQQLVSRELISNY